MFELQVELTQQEDGWWLIRCPAIQGLLVEGQTIGQALDELPVVAQALWESCREHDRPFVAAHPEAKPEDITWQVTIPQLQKAA
jgi:predicted RNase H-like HicB family nuclease